MKPKGRPKKARKILFQPKITKFSPRGKPGRPDEIQLTRDHLEAFKLADYEGRSQAQGAESMGISRATFGRILREAQKLISDALINGKIIRFEK